MNVYDFDGTIYNGDTNKDLIKYAFKKYPKLVWKSLMSARKLKKEYEHNLIEYERVKEELLSFIFKIKYDINVQSKPTIPLITSILSVNFIKFKI